jgi:hypothetical protein
MEILRLVKLGLFLPAPNLNLRLFFLFPHTFSPISDSSTRVLLIADPQMEGSSKVAREGFIGELDLAFNDFYIRHVFQVAQRLQVPTHTVVLGDVFSSEFIDLKEFHHRVQRFKSIFVNPPFHQHFFFLFHLQKTEPSSR